MYANPDTDPFRVRYFFSNSSNSVLRIKMRDAVLEGVLKELVNTRRDTVAQQGAPDTSLDDELPTTSAGASGQEAPPQDHHTSTPPPADGEPPRKQSLRSRTRRENNAKTPAKK
ncbi:hypothetical protein NDU88_003783 [Pleurodeles waltl]|uniref:Uncharacterized protein n=1 Tax=Pleurodeles waltl TaxID=8319 RepID=A0AAV7QE72_PLEWA|nr:hypothetical protein NDU88_003783 [Pleurodeles waltl]